MGDVPDPNTFNFVPGTEDLETPTPVTQATCDAEAAQRGAELWTFTPGDPPQCRMSAFAHLSDATYVSGAVTQVKADICAATACPTASPVGVWPGEDAAASNSAFGVGGRQPFGLQCWPKNSVHEMLDCGSSTVQTHLNHWPARCNDLNHYAPADTTMSAAVCRTACANDPFCSVWLYGTPSGDGEDDDANAQCYTGVGNECWTASTGTNSIGRVLGAERLQHGQVNVIVENFTDFVLNGLHNQFQENVQVTVDETAEDGTVSQVTRGMTEDEQKENCRIICHSNIECTFWQSYYNDGTSANLGCYTESPGVQGGLQDAVAGFVAYPTTSDAFAPEDTDQQYITGGQYIQHFCPEPTLPTRPPTTTTTTTTQVTQLPGLQEPVVEEGSFWWPYGALILAVCALVVVAALAVMMQSNAKPAGKKQTRGVDKLKSKPKPAAPAPPPPPPQQPVVPLMVQQPVPIQTIAAPLQQMTTIQQPGVPVAMAQPYPFQQVVRG